MGFCEQTLGNWVKKDKVEWGETEGLSSDDRAELARLRRENAGCGGSAGVLKRSVVGWVTEATR